MIDEKQLEAYRAAGELFGLLDAALGFGSLTMHKEARVFVFSWGFTAGGKSYGSQLFVDTADILFGYDAKTMAKKTATQWKNEHRRLSQ